MNKLSITIPSWFRPGMKFNSSWINKGVNTCTLLSYNKDNNTAEVFIEAGGSEFTENDWNLQHTMWGFEKGEYSIIKMSELAVMH